MDSLIRHTFNSALIYSYFCAFHYSWHIFVSNESVTCSVILLVFKSHILLSTGQPHEGSGYASQKVLQMAWHRLEHARSRVNELERIKNKHLQGRALLRPQPQLNQNHQNGSQSTGGGTTG